ncbi:DUF58 domain-containing protein [Microbacterium thalassium]|uniref:Uncharacterized protein (DUF58 family) n=1 Tax=Microbacterium thalassium TaxID=362649 RepID=A0A7X0FT17_9MICO|nr:DUF58 domain-containing protein [Microbacterium thalassium]MBB6392650.1 uncharacterized protein (DUF58 family) [Microbacterium thalassium]GLK23119.1 membrane protein [Microbacterium thalassium]
MSSIWPFTPRGTGALVLGVAAFIAAGELGLVELVYFGVLLVAAVLTSLISLYVAQRTDSVERALHPDVVAVGREAEVTVRVGARSALPTATGLWHDALPVGLAGSAEGVFPALASGLRGAERTVDLSYRVRGTSRGIHAIGPLSVRVLDPFGLVRRNTVLGDRTRVVVAPEVVELPSLRIASGESGGMRHMTNERLGQGSDNLTPRTYVPGDSMRRIHWRASAHHDSLMVRQEEQESTPEATVMLDRSATRWDPLATAAPGADPGFEVAVSACVSAMARLVRDGFAVDVADSDGVLLADPIAGGDLVEVDHAVADFASLRARNGDTLPRLPHLFVGAMTGPLVLIVGRFDPADADALASVAHHTSAAILLAVDPRADALERATAHGWHAARVGEGEVADAWAQAAETEAGRVLR